MVDLIMAFPVRWSEEYSSELFFSNNRNDISNETGIFLADSERVSENSITGPRFYNYRINTFFDHKVNLGDVTREVVRKAFYLAFEAKCLWSFAIIVGPGTSYDARREIFFFENAEDALMFRMAL